MTLRDQASERLTDATLQFAWPDLPLEDCEDARAVVLDALQPLFDQVAREKLAWVARAITSERFRSEDAADHVDEQIALVKQRDDLRAKLTEMTDERDAAREDIVALRDAVHDHHVRLTQAEEALKLFQWATPIAKPMPGDWWVCRICNAQWAAGPTKPGAHPSSTCVVVRAALDRG